MTERYLWERGGSNRRKTHLAGYDRLGRFAGALCGSSIPFNRSCNLPLGRKVCRRCIAVENRLSATQTQPEATATRGE